MRTAIFCILVAIGGCMAPPVNPDPAANYHADSLACDQEVAKLVSSMRVAAPPPSGRYSTDCTTYGNQTTCETRPSGGGVANASLNGYILGMTVSAHPKCMAAKGWRRP